jgi:hypothetical protein
MRGWYYISFTIATLESNRQSLLILCSLMLDYLLVSVHMLDSSCVLHNEDIFMGSLKWPI